MPASPAIDVSALIDERPVSHLQWRVVLLGFIIIALDGFDTAIMGFIAPELARVWGIAPSHLGPVLSAALVGLALGAMGAGPLADRVGRKAVLVGSVFLFGLWTLVAAWSPDLNTLLVLRFLTGLGLGASMPNVGTLVSEYAPRKHRSILVTVVFCGFTFGAAMGGFCSAWLIPAYGWHSVLLVGGILPVLLAPVLLFKLPESLRFLAVKRGDQARMRAIVAQLAPEVARRAGSFMLPQAAQGMGKPASAIGTVLSRRYAFGSAMLWITYFMGLFLVYLLGGWLPTLVKGVGFSVRDAALITALFQIGGAAGSLGIGWAMDRINPHRVLALAFLLGGAATFLFGTAAKDFIALSLCAFAGGFLLNGANTGMNALATGYYPTAARATGSSWMHGIGRWGAISSAFAGAQMLGAGWSFAQVFSALAIPALIAALAIFAKGGVPPRAARPAHSNPPQHARRI
ncbi:MFS transporter [Cupriavidus basilensis]|uniref:MFS transporter n=1 Tax=Cupriavidus basilensis TaxID=68895 RepID=UPI00283CC90D|nr:MFS transporter [Cupriavidus basilensis]MDR3381310.1 MFS transporter [Cupriavidus basilensis]